MVLGVCHFDLCTSKMKWISEFSIQTEQSGPAVFSRLAITQVETDASQYKPFQLSSDKYFQYLQIFLDAKHLYKSPCQSFS